MGINFDVEAIFKFNDNIKRYSGYRPAHLIKDDCLTTGLHEYYPDTDGEISKGKIAFITPEHYSKCLWVGKEIPMYDGTKLIGVATITEIFNKELEK